MPDHRITRLDSQLGTLWTVESAIRETKRRFRWNIVAVFQSHREAVECLSSMAQGREPSEGRLPLQDG